MGRALLAALCCWLFLVLQRVQTMSEVTCEFVPRHPLQLACDTGATRYALDGACVEPMPGGRVVCAATNSRILAVVTEEGTATGQHLAPADAFKVKANSTASVAKNGAWQQTTVPKRGPTTVATLEDVTGRFPRWRDVLPNIETGHVVQVALDARQLFDLAQALGAGNKTGLDAGAVTLFITEREHEGRLVCDSSIGVLYRNAELGTAVGVLMPHCADKPVADDLLTAEKRCYVNFVKSLGQTPEPVPVA